MEQWNTEDSIYGKRDGALPGLAIISNSGRSHYKQTRGWKTGVVHGIPMLARSEMWKPELVARKTKKSIIQFHSNVFSQRSHLAFEVSPHKNSLPHLGKAMTDIQELKQVSRWNI